MGDLYLFIHVDEKPRIRRDGLNLYSDISIDYTEAILGTIVKVTLFEYYKLSFIVCGAIFFFSIRSTMQTSVHYI